MKITADMIVSDIMNMDPGVIPIFMEHGLYCMGCFMSGDESLEEAAQVDMVDLDHLILSLNQYFGFDTGDYDMNGNEAGSSDYDATAKPMTEAERDELKVNSTAENDNSKPESDRKTDKSKDALTGL
ncbi:DUF1858 domain-containing protein [Amygdalobacter nucleatus]|uniref:Hydrid cluster protein-associated redox disulfide domain protein n=1 Tax=Amygdalobacter nucleatus TaxID=3029274 RepID=A0A133Y6C7_9FIRM|nr:DUF1858 domain-containing protein [Amygdalobacter nucleatus]KXB38759.1 hydrid cluster protein-associated redox disulfide domain protein [Amygdalobacter nucleatus]MDF0485941.1 DUF1858 domain-containing protein [Amygdalobacter nucleatus]WEG36278.1 DUF1858 domain-containing protein [Amygdalobacter nucleatus]